MSDDDPAPVWWLVPLYIDPDTGVVTYGKPYAVQDDDEAEAFVPVTVH